MRHITKSFGDIKANDDINLEVLPGEVHALLGENGAGKTTLMNMLGGLDIPDFGGVWIRNTSLKDLSKEERTIFRRRY